MQNVIAARDESGLECPACGSQDWSRANGLDKSDGRLLHAFYTCERPSCDGRFRVAFERERRVEVVVMWSDWPGAIERARALAPAPQAPERAGSQAPSRPEPEPACVQASFWPAATAFKEGITLF